MTTRIEMARAVRNFAQRLVNYGETNEVAKKLSDDVAQTLEDSAVELEKPIERAVKEPKEKKSRKSKKSG